MRRTLNDLRLQAATCYEPLVPAVLAEPALLQGRRHLTLIVDESTQEERTHLLRVSLAYWGGALPLAWASLVTLCLGIAAAQARLAARRAQRRRRDRPSPHAHARASLFRLAYRPRAPISTRPRTSWCAGCSRRSTVSVGTIAGVTVRCSVPSSKLSAYETSMASIPMCGWLPVMSTCARIIVDLVMTERSVANLARAQGTGWE